MVTCEHAKEAQKKSVKMGNDTNVLNFTTGGGFGKARQQDIGQMVK